MKGKFFTPFAEHYISLKHITSINFYLFAWAAAVLGQQLLFERPWKPELDQDRAYKLNEYSKSRHQNELLYRSNPPKHKRRQDG